MHKIYAEGITPSETFMVTNITEKRLRWWVWNTVWWIMCTTWNHTSNHCTVFPSAKQSCWTEKSFLEMMNAMMISSGLPQNMWGEAILSSNYLLNKAPWKKEDKTPYELWKWRKPSYKFLWMWGCLTKVIVPIPKKVKIGLKTVDCISLDMHKTVVLIDSWSISLPYQIYTKTW